MQNVGLLLPDPEIEAIADKNCRHIANATELPRLYRLLEDLQLPRILICTPAQFLGDADDARKRALESGRPIVQPKQRTMPETASQLLATFESLPANEKHELLVAMLRRGSEMPATIMTNDELVGIADELFQTLDAEESNGDNTESR